MTLNLANPDFEYEKDENLKKNDVKALLDWANQQPHLPKINELQGIIFLQSNNYSNEAAKTALDNYFTYKTLCSDMYGSRNPFVPPLKDAIDGTLFTALPKRTPDGYTVFFIKSIVADVNKFVFVDQIRFFDMVFLLHLYLEGTSKGHLIVYDMKGFTLGYITKMAPFVLKRFVNYVQDAMPVKLKGVHFLNSSSFMDKFMGLLRPFMKKELANLFNFHSTVDDLDQVLPREYLPKDYGGAADESSVLHEKMKRELLENVAIFQWEESQKVEEALRPGKPKNVSDIFGVEGTFKQLEID